MVLRQGLRLAFAGAIIGLTGAFIVSRLMVHLLYNVQPGDPITFFGVAILFISVAFLACYMPALRATKVDPMIALRD